MAYYNNNLPEERRASDITTAQPNAQTQALIGRQAQEVQAAVYMAKQFPRDIDASINRIIRACQRESLARVAVYEYPRGGQKVSGASIRLAEAIAQNYGNIDTGIIELERKNGESVAMAYAWDLETNYRQQKVFTVQHVRETKSGSKVLTDSRDIYELVANQGARRQRACILSMIPGDIVDMALHECQETLRRGGNGMTIEQRIEEAAAAFFNEFGITKEMLEARYQRNLASFSENILVDLQGIYNSLRDGMSRPEQWFQMAVAPRMQQPAPEEAAPAIDMKALAEEMK